MSDYRYPWPSSQLTRADMRLLHNARESSPDRTTITELVARAIRVQYGHLAIKSEPSSESVLESVIRPAA